MADDGDTCSDGRARDWASDWRAFVGLWGVPGGAMLAALLLEPTWRAVAWTTALTWMGGACLLNARRCGRTHCWVTGPFLLGMAALVAGYGAGVVPLGPNGWLMLGSVTATGFAGLWWGSERLWGRFSGAKAAPQPPKACPPQHSLVHRSLAENSCDFPRPRS